MLLAAESAGRAVCVEKTRAHLPETLPVRTFSASRAAAASSMSRSLRFSLPIARNNVFFRSMLSELDLLSVISEGTTDVTARGAIGRHGGLTNACAASAKYQRMAEHGGSPLRLASVL